MKWEPAQYEKFKNERSAPFAELAGLIDLRKGMRIVDLGCGTGELTLALTEMAPDSDALGIDSSESMLERANLLARPGLRFAQRSIEDIDGEWDLIFSNAAIHWVDDHPGLLRRLRDRLAPGGQLAVQVPSNHHHYAHTAIAELAGREPYLGALNGWTRTVPVLSIDAYAALLHELGFESVDVFEKVFAHILADVGAVAQWTRGTALLPYLERLPADLAEAFFADYEAMLAARMPERPVFYPFRRTFFYGRLPG